MDNIQTQSALSVEYKVDFGNDNGGGKENVSKTRKSPGKKESKSSPKFPHVTRLLALAHHLQGLIDKGIVRDYADIARLSNLSRARLSQIMNLTLLSPQIQEEILFSQSSLKEKSVRKILQSPVWEEQINIWEQQKALIN